MIILDENFPDSQRQLLEGWRFSIRQIAFEIGREGLKDDEIIPLLHAQNRPTFITLDSDFFKPKLCHAQYCLVYLDVAQYESAAFVRRALKHRNFDTKAKRMGHVVRVSHKGIISWELKREEKVLYKWSD